MKRKGGTALGQLWPLEGGGTLRAREEGEWVYLEAVRPDNRKGLYKVWCAGPGGEFLLGTLVPQGGGLRLERRVSKQTLQEAGAWPLNGGKAVMAYSFTNNKRMEGVWHREEHPERLCTDRVVQACLCGSEGWFSRECGSVRQLSVSFSICKPILLNPLFCLAQVEERQGRRYLVWSFDRDGLPVMPEMERKHREK